MTDGFWYRLSRFVMRFPGRIALVTACVLIALGMPALGITFNVADAQVLPTSAAARQVDDALRADFPPLPRHAGDAGRVRQATPRGSPRRRPTCPAWPRCGRRSRWTVAL